MENTIKLCLLLTQQMIVAACDSQKKYINLINLPLYLEMQYIKLNLAYCKHPNEHYKFQLFCEANSHTNISCHL